jgi:hypothetical protein
MNMNVTNLRPIYFNLVIWGEGYRRYLVDYCLPSLLSPRNIPCLINGRKNKFLFCTTKEDWRHLQEYPIFHRLGEYIEPVLVEIPPLPEGVSNCIHMGVGHKQATEITYRDKAYGIALTPDLLVSDGSIEAVQKHALAGKHLVYTAALRFAEENLFHELAAQGIVNDQDRKSMTGDPLVASGRQLIKAGLRSLHSETMRYEWDAPYFTDFPVACFWRVPGEEGIVLHSFSWAPFLLDYSIVNDHNTDTFDEWTFDGDYVYKNFYNAKNIHIVQDSDEIMLVSWAPWADKELSLEPARRNTSRFLARMNKGMALYDIYHSDIMDPLKRKIFQHSVYWHAGSVTEAYKKTDSKVSKLVKYYTVGPSIKVLSQTTNLNNLPNVSLKGAVFFSHIPVMVNRGIVNLTHRSLKLKHGLWSWFVKSNSYIRLYGGYVLFLVKNPIRILTRAKWVIDAFMGNEEARERVNRWKKEFGITK